MRSRPRAARLRRREPEPGAARTSPTAGLAEKGKNGGKGHWGRGRGRGPRAASSRQKNSTEGGGESPLQFPPPRHRKLSGNYFQSPRALLTLASSSRRTKPFLDKARGCPLGSGKGPREPLRPSLPPDPLGTTAVMGRLGLRGAWPRQAPALLRARLVLRWIPVFIFDLFFIL